MIQSNPVAIPSNMGVQNSKDTEQTFLHMLSEYTHSYFNAYFKIPNFSLVCFLEGEQTVPAQYQETVLDTTTMYPYHIPWEGKKYRKCRQVWPCVHLRMYVATYLNCSWWHSQNRPLRASILLKYCVHIYQVCKTFHGYNTQVGFSTRNKLHEHGQLFNLPSRNACTVEYQINRCICKAVSSVHGCVSVT